MKKIKNLVVVLSVLTFTCAYAQHTDPFAMDDEEISTIDIDLDEDDEVAQEVFEPAAVAAVPADVENDTAQTEKEKTEESTPATGDFMIDRIVSVVFGPEDTDIITDSEARKPSIEGEPRTLDGIEFEKLVYQDAKKFRITPDEEAIDKYLASVQKQHNLNLDQLKGVFASAGYTYEEGREQFGIMYTVNSMLEFKIRSRLMVPEREVEAYYKAHPEYEETAYQVSRAFIPFSTRKDKDDLRERVQAYASSNGKSKELKQVKWEEPFWIKESEVSDEKQFITSLNPGSIAQPVETEHGFELIKLIAKRARRERPIEERYKEIADLLRKPRYDQLFKEYKEELFKQSAIVRY